MQQTNLLLWNFIETFADPKVACLGKNQLPAFRPYQFQTAAAIFDSILLQHMRLLTVRMARQMGKTEIIGIATSAAAYYVNLLMNLSQPAAEGLPFGPELRYAFPDGLQVGIFGPREDTARVDYSRMRRILTNVIRKMQPFGWRFDVNNELKQTAVCPAENGRLRQLWYLEVLSAAPSSEIESRSFNTIILEECQDIEPHKILDDILPMGAASKATVIPVGTIGDKKSWFDDAIEFNRAQHPEHHFEFDYRVGIDQDFRDGAYGEHIAREIAQHGYDSESFRKMYRLERVFDRDLLMNEDTFIDLADPFEKPWTRQPAELPPQLVLVAGLDIARDYDSTVLKVGTADWNSVRSFGSESEVTLPRLLVRWKKTYPQKPHDEQFAELHHDLQTLFPGLKKFGAIAYDATGDRGDYTTKLQAAGYFAIPVIFTGGVKPTELNERGDIIPGSKSAMCINYSEAISQRLFGYAADESYMGTVDYFRRLRKPKPDGSPIVPPSAEYAKHKLECTACQRLWSGNGRLDLRAPKKSHAHDDEVDSDLLFCLAGIYFRPVDLSKFTPLGQRRTFLPDQLSESFQTLRRIFS